MSVIADRLSPFTIFAGLEGRDLTFIAANCKENVIPSGTILIREGQVGKDVYLLEEGRARVYRGHDNARKELAVVEAPSILGEMALLDPERIRTSSVVALSDLSLLSIPIPTFLVLLGVYPSVKRSIRQLVDSRG